MQRIKIMIRRQPQYAVQILETLQSQVGEIIQDLEGGLGYVVLNKQYKTPTGCQDCKYPPIPVEAEDEDGELVSEATEPTLIIYQDENGEFTIA